MLRTTIIVVLVITLLVFTISIIKCEKINKIRENLFNRTEKVNQDTTDTKRLTLSRIINVPKSDIERFGTWEYKVITLKTNDEKVLLDTLNSLGKQRYECFWIEDLYGERRFYLKKAPITLIGILTNIKPQ